MKKKTPINIHYEQSTNSQKPFFGANSKRAFFSTEKYPFSPFLQPKELMRIPESAIQRQAEEKKEVPQVQPLSESASSSEQRQVRSPLAVAALVGCVPFHNFHYSLNSIPGTHHPKPRNTH